MPGHVLRTTETYNIFDRSYSGSIAHTDPTIAKQNTRTCRLELEVRIEAHPPQKESL